MAEYEGWVGKPKNEQEMSENQHRNDNDNDRQTSAIAGIAIALGAIGALSILGGIILATKGWPGDAGYGYSWTASAYTPSLTWLFSGLISGVIFFAFSAITTYLYNIRENTETLILEVRRTKEKTEPINGLRKSAEEHWQGGSDVDLQ